MLQFQNSDSFRKIIGKSSNGIFDIYYWFRSKLVTHKKSLGDKIVRTMRTTKKIKAPPKPSDEDTESDQVSHH